MPFEVLVGRMPALCEASLMSEQAAPERCGRFMLLERVAAGRIVDGHGDMRPELVCLLHPPVVIDALEFNPRLRRVDG